MSRVPALVLALCLGLGLSLIEAVQASALPGAHQVVGPATATSGVVALRAGRYHRWRAPRGPFFNDPHRRAGRFRIERRVVETVRHARRGSTIRIAVYSLDRMPVADALVAAHRRGVNVQMLLNDHQDTRAMRRIRRAVGTDRDRRSFIYKCKAGCRSTANQYNNLHSKFYSFTRAGRSRHVLAIGSANLTLNAALHQWNDLYFTSGDQELFRQFVNLFNNMKKDFGRRRPPRHFCGTPTGAECDDSVDKHTVRAFPRRSGPKNDLVIDMLDKVQCLTPDGAGGHTRTRLALSMHTMRGKRGDYLAAAIRDKYAEGCAFRVNYGLIGYHTKKILGAPTERGRIPLRSTGLDYNPEDNYDLNRDGKDDLILSYYSHQKYLVIQGTYNGVPDSDLVLTGSSNWASLSTGNDEIWLTIRGRRLTTKYVRNFNYQWNHRRNSRNAYTTTYASFRGYGRRPITTIERDPYRKGPYWEAD